jgi:NAD(P)-dependent dehydrogenase (short-subunit alcohol dehydrogenase family)
LRVAIVTGGSKGIGKAIAKKFRDEGIRVAVVARSDAPDCDLYIRHDLSTGAGDVVKQVYDEFGQLDILVNNAGSHQSYEADYKLMADAPYQLSKQAARYMTEGHIINILSTSSIQGVRNVLGYVMAKHAALGLTRALALELAPDIHVNGIIPGLIDTDMTSNYTQSRRELLDSLIPAHRFGQAEDVAEAAWFLANSRYIYGHSLVVDGGWMVKNG